MNPDIDHQATRVLQRQQHHQHCINPLLLEAIESPLVSDNATHCVGMYHQCPIELDLLCEKINNIILNANCVFTASAIWVPGDAATGR